MGLGLGSLTVALDVNDRKLRTGLLSAKIQTDKFGRALTKTGRRAKKTGSMISLAFAKTKKPIQGSRTAILALTASITALGAVSVRAGRSYSKAFGEIRAITGATGEQLRLIEKATKRYAATTTKGATEVLLLTKTIASLRPELLKDAEALDAITGSVITLSEAAGITGVEAAEALGNTLNQFGLEAKDANRVINSLAAASQLSAKEIPFLTQALKEAGPVAKALNIPFETTVAILEGLGKSGLDASKAGTGFRNFFSILQTEGIGDFNVQANGAIGAIEGLIASNLDFAGSSDLFGREVVVASEAIKQQLGHIKELLPAIKGTNTAFEQAAINANTFDGRMKNLGNRINLSAIALSQKFEPAILAAGESLVSFFSTITESGPGVIEGLISQLVKLGNVADGVFKKLGATTRAAFGSFGSGLVGKGASVLGSSAGAFGLKSLSDDLFAFSGDVARNPNKRPTQDEFKAQLGQIDLDTQRANKKVDEIFTQLAIDRTQGVKEDVPDKQVTKTVDENFAGFSQRVDESSLPQLGSIAGPTRSAQDTDRIVQEMRLMRMALERGENTLQLKIEVDENNIVRLVTKNPAFQKEFDKRAEDAARQIAK